MEQLPRPPASDPAHSPAPARPAPAQLEKFAAVFYGAMFAVAWLWTRVARTPLFIAEGEPVPGLGQLLSHAAAGVAVGLLLIWLSREMTRRWRGGAQLARALGRTLGPLSWRSCLVLAALSSVAEEALFRGALQPRVGWVAASLIFGAVHFVPRKEFALWTATSVGAGFALGGLYEWTGNLAAPVATHAVVNAVNLRWLAVHYGGDAAAVGPERDPSSDPRIRTD